MVLATTISPPYGLTTKNVLFLDTEPKEEPEVEDIYQSLKKDIFDKIQLPSCFNSQMLIDRYVEHIKNLPPKEKKEFDEKQDILKRLSYNRARVIWGLEKGHNAKQFPNHVYDYFTSLIEFRSLISDLTKNRDSINYYFFETNVPPDFIDLLDLSYQTEEIGSKIIGNIIKELTDELRVGKKKFIFYVQRSGKHRMKKYIEKCVKLIDKIFELSSSMEDSRLKIVWYLRAWNSETIDEFPFPENIDFNKVDRDTFSKYFEDFVVGHTGHREYLLDNYYDTFIEVETISEPNTKKFYNEALDILIFQ